MKQLFAWTLLLGVAATSGAQVVLSDGNSSASIDPTSDGLPFLRGLNSWEVDGVNQVFQQWYWFRVGESREHPIDEIGDAVVTQSAPNSANVAYSNAAVSIDITFTLAGGTAGSRTADISEIVRIVNRSSATLDIHLFEYDDFDVSGTFEDDSAMRLDPSSIVQFDELNKVTVGSVAAPDRWQISEVPDIFDLLDDGVASNLGNTATSNGPGDLAFAFQWDRTLAPGQTFLMSKNELVEAVPEPMTLLAMALGLAGLKARRRQGSP
ncbi:MAG TPA: PEP-CTERM sorting domain-containing protein [Fimbriimonadaceae bacterium]|nr:PEP-CTERM sorting domain-containing protein [Fimbriimonadaceae bacterium]